MYGNETNSAELPDVEEIRNQWTNSFLRILFPIVLVSNTDWRTDLNLNPFISIHKKKSKKTFVSII